MGSLHSMFSMQCKHAAGFTPVLFEKVSATLTQVRAVLCVICGKVVPVPPIISAPKATPTGNAAPADTPAGVHAMPNGADPCNAK